MAISAGEITVRVRAIGSGPAPGFYFHPAIPGEVYYLDTRDDGPYVTYTWRHWIVGGGVLDVPLDEMRSVWPHLKQLGYIADDEQPEADPTDIGTPEVRDLTPAGIFRGLAVYFDQSNGTISWPDSTLAQMMAEEAVKLEREATERYYIEQVTERGWEIRDRTTGQAVSFGSLTKAKAALASLVAGDGNWSWDDAAPAGDHLWATPAELDDDAVGRINQYEVQRRGLPGDDAAVYRWGVWDHSRELFAPITATSAAISSVSYTVSALADGRRDPSTLSWTDQYTVQLTPTPEAAPTPNPRYIVAYRAREHGSRYFPGVYDEATGRFFHLGDAESAERIRERLESDPRYKVAWSQPGEWPIGEVEEAVVAEVAHEYRVQRRSTGALDPGSSWGVYDEATRRFAPCASRDQARGNWEAVSLGNIEDRVLRWSIPGAWPVMIQHELTSQPEVK